MERGEVRRNEKEMLVRKVLLGAVALAALAGVVWAQGSPSVGLTASPGQVAPGGEVTLSWNAPWATECQATGAWAGVKAPVGSETVTPSRSGDYGLTCRGPMASGSAGVVVADAAPPPPPPPPDPDPVPGPLAACLEQPTFVPSVTSGQQASFAVRAGRTADFRGKPTPADPPLRPVRGDPTEANGCIHGIKVFGRKPTGITWDVAHSDQYRGSAGLFSTQTGSPAILENAHIYNMTDGWGTTRGASKTTDFRTIIRGTYMVWIRDDAVENDYGCYSVLVKDSLLDGISMGFSARPGGDALCPSQATQRAFTIEDSLIRFACMQRDPGEQSRGCPTNQGHQFLFKYRGGSAGAMRANMKNVVVKYDAMPMNGPSTTAGLCYYPLGNYENVTIVWNSALGAWPCAPKAGITVTTDQTVWTRARDEWLTRHSCQINNGGPGSPGSCAFTER